MRKILMILSAVALALSAGIKKLDAAERAGSCASFCPPGDSSWCGGTCDTCLKNENPIGHSWQCGSPI
jgi:hypothetical protein